MTILFYFSVLPLWLRQERIRFLCGRPGFSLWVGKIPWRRERLPTAVFCPGEFHGLYSPWGCKESDTAEQLSLSLIVNKESEMLYSGAVAKVAK